MLIIQENNLFYTKTRLEFTRKKIADIISDGRVYSPNPSLPNIDFLLQFRKWGQIGSKAEEMDLPVVLDKWKIPIWISCHNRQTSAPSATMWNPSRYRLRTSGKPRIPGGQYIDQLIYGCDPIQCQRFPFQWCSGREHNCWLRLPFRWSIAQDGTIDDMCQYVLHLFKGRHYVLLCFSKRNKFRDLPTTVGSKSTKTALGTCLPEPVSLKKVLKESSPPPTVLSEGIWPSGWIPCSRQYSSQQALPICTPACPMCTEIHSLWNELKKNGWKT